MWYFAWVLGIGFAVLGGVFGEGVDLPGERLIGAFVATLGLSNLVSNVPAVMVLMPLANTDSGDHVGVTLALVSTMAGNLLIVGSIANLIVVDAAARCGITIDWRRHARTGVPVTLVTLAVVAGWLALR